MKNRIPHLICFFAAGLIAQAASFEEMTTHLDTDGTLIGYINFEGDGAEIGTQLNAIYADAMTTIPGMMPIPLDFPTLFDTLGFGSMQAFALSSKEVEGGLHANRSVAAFDGGPTGLFAIFGTPKTRTLPFQAAELAPADATGAISGALDLRAIRDTAKNLMIQVMGPMGEDVANQRLQGFIPGTEITINEAVEALSGHWDLFWKEEYDEDFNPSYQGWLKIEGAAVAVEKLMPLIADPSLGATLIETESGFKANLSVLTEGEGFNLFVETDRAENIVLIYSSPEWGPGSEGLRLSETADFKKLSGQLPEEALIYSYTAGYQMSTVMNALKSEPSIAPYAGLGEKVAALVLGDFLEPTTGALYFEDNYLISEGYAGYSTKQAVMIIPASMVGATAAMAAMAVSPFKQVRSAAKEKTVKNNLRQIASAAQQYFLETGETKVSIEKLTGPNGYIRKLEPVAGESYENMVISVDDEVIEVTLGDGSVISHSF